MLQSPFKSMTLDENNPNEYWEKFEVKEDPDCEASRDLQDYIPCWLNWGISFHR